MEQKTTPLGRRIYCRPYDSPCGRLILGAIGNALCLCDWDIPDRRKVIDLRLKAALKAEMVMTPSPVTDMAAAELDEYFAGRRTHFDIPLLMAGSDFRKDVWQALLSIPYGQTLSYSKVAGLSGHPAAIRAVGTAIGANPMSIFVPCHRVTLQSGAIGQYAGGTPAKVQLLALEKARAGHA